MIFDPAGMEINEAKSHDKHRSVRGPQGMPPPSWRQQGAAAAEAGAAYRISHVAAAPAEGEN